MTPELVKTCGGRFLTISQHQPVRFNKLFSLGNQIKGVIRHFPLFYQHSDTPIYHDGNDSCINICPDFTVLLPFLYEVSHSRDAFYYFIAGFFNKLRLVLKQFLCKHNGNQRWIFLKYLKMIFQFFFKELKYAGNFRFVTEFCLFANCIEQSNQNLRFAFIMPVNC